MLIFNFFKKNRLNGKEFIKNEERIARNSKKPIYGKWKFELIEDMVIGKTPEESSVFVEPWKWKVKIDRERNIFVLDSKECKVLKFSKSGNLTSIMGRKGEGPASFPDQGHGS